MEKETWLPRPETERLKCKSLVTVGCSAVSARGQVPWRRGGGAVQVDGELPCRHQRSLLLRAQLQHLLHVLHCRATMERESPVGRGRRRRPRPPCSSRTFSVMLLQDLSQVQSGFSQEGIGPQRVVAPDFEIQLCVGCYIPGNSTHTHTHKQLRGDLCLLSPDCLNRAAGFFLVFCPWVRSCGFPGSIRTGPPAGEAPQVTAPQVTAPQVCQRLPDRRRQPALGTWTDSLGRSAAARRGQKHGWRRRVWVRTHHRGSLSASAAPVLVDQLKYWSAGTGRAQLGSREGQKHHKHAGEELELTGSASPPTLDWRNCETLLCGATPPPPSPPRKRPSQRGFSSF